MTGPEHFAAAEKALAEAADAMLGSDAEAYSLAAAQVHATLALTVATLDTSPTATSSSWAQAVNL